MNTLRIFNHYIHVDFLLLGFIQCLLLVTAVYAAALIRFQEQAVSFGVLLPKALLFTATIVLAMVAMGIYQRQRRDGHLQIILRVTASFALAGIGLGIIFYLIPPLYMGRGVMALAAAIGFAGTIALQLWYYLNVDRNESNWRVLFYGAGRNAASTLFYLRRRSDHRMFSLSGCVPAPGETTQVDPALIRHPEGVLLDYARMHGINEIVVAMDNRRHEFPASELLDCRMAGINITDMLTFYERQTGKVKTDLLWPGWIIFSYGFRHSGLQNVVKRGLDLFIAVLLLVVLSPAMLLSAIAILIEDGLRASVFFAQTRVGKDGRPFQILKFRSMRADAESDGAAQWAVKNDPRVTCVGSFIRRYRLDELPQLLNVLKGEMSLVGPRPEGPEFVQQLSEKFPYYGVRHHVKPGITGWAQLGYPYGASEDDANAKLQLDLYYVKNRSTFLDFLILLGTAEVVLFRKGAR